MEKNGVNANLAAYFANQRENIPVLEEFGGRYSMSDVARLRRQSQEVQDDIQVWLANLH